MHLLSFISKNCLFVVLVLYLFLKSFFFLSSHPKTMTLVLLKNPFLCWILMVIASVWVQFGFCFFIYWFGLVFLPLVIAIVIVIIIITVIVIAIVCTCSGFPTLEFPISCTKEEEIKLQTRTGWISKRCKDYPSLSTGRNERGSFILSEW